MLTISKEQQKFIDLFLLDTYHSFSDEEQIEFDENEDLGESKIIERQLESFHKLNSSEELHYLMKSWNWDPSTILHNMESVAFFKTTPP